ncbi:hypothetical protein MCOR25_000198 [Pyricularia grisea]|uniref:Uncharacterized protein n=1 Tax=Pyricularia grisea TaxID=148305 RepID=A0A6P8BJT5_PYRGI|nr:uncharacterized protein PgNI_02314 [Pyricularia grisea]KAI6383279.1 hypothetical protein MCOR25_000198 [Pyricularia grisea]TLD16842.1 hypothetical protein PgNI_02314 [Pyricularia grisea]
MHIKTVLTIAWITHAAIAVPSEEQPSVNSVVGKPPGLKPIKMKPSSKSDAEDLCKSASNSCSSGDRPDAPTASGRAIHAKFFGGQHNQPQS